MLAFCQHTFSWGDYIPDVWDTWLANENGQLLVGLVDHQAVGLAHVAFLERAVAWLEGMRVHPDFRRRGISTTLDAAARAVARERGCRLARLATSIQNTPAQNALEVQGYTRVAQFNEWTGKPARAKFAPARIATLDDADSISAIWRASDISAAARVLPNRHWSWIELDEARVRKLIQSSEVRVTPRGFAFLLAFDEKDWSSLSLHALCGDDAAMRALALAARGEAKYRGYPRVEAIVADHPSLNAALERAGYRREGGMYIYEQTL